MNNRRFSPSYFLPFFIFLVIIDLIVVSLDFTTLRHFSKPLIVLSLFIYFAINGRKLNRSIYLLMLSALFFSWLGDVFLMYDSISDTYFMLGLFSFLTAHILYCLLFIKRWNKNATSSFWAVLALLIIYGTVLFHNLKEGLGKLVIPVIAYIIAILLMAVTAFRRKGMVNTNSFKLVFIGALFFIISDSVLAINKFLVNLPFSHLVVMATYATAQYLITKGILLQDPKDALYENNEKLDFQ